MDGLEVAVEAWAVEASVVGTLEGDEEELPTASDLLNRAYASSVKSFHKVLSSFATSAASTGRRQCLVWKPPAQ